MLISSAGLVGVTYGMVEAGQNGWADPGAMTALVAGALVLVGFGYWERRFAGGRRAGTQPLIDLSLFRSASFTWATILATFVSFAIFGILFATPLYFQEVHGADALGTGLRLLPLVSGLVVGMFIGERSAKAARAAVGRVWWGSAKTNVAAGLALMAVGLYIGAFTTVNTPDLVSGVWLLLAGVGFGLAVPAAMNVALGALAPERSGVGAAVVSALRQVGATLGVAVLGTVLNTVYRGQLAAADLPQSVEQQARRSVAAGVAAAEDLHSGSALAAVRAAFVDGLDVMLWVCAGTATAAVVLAVVFLPHGGGQPAVRGGQDESSGSDEKPATVG
ncbi:MFS transporter [Planosporangium sp. 12N6]|uniref:MFS transporter n=1 Tax=Planosporangium spinosum TaxID=3402278 RepID=UPI003CED21AE